MYQFYLRYNNSYFFYSQLFKPISYKPNICETKVGIESDIY